MAGLTFLVKAITEKVVFEQNPEGLREQARWPAGKWHSGWRELSAKPWSAVCSRSSGAGTLNAGRARKERGRGKGVGGPGRPGRPDHVGHCEMCGFYSQKAYFSEAF